MKEDGSQAQLEEKLSFKVIEFNKEAKRIIVSHSRVFEDEQRAAAKAERAENNAQKDAEKSAVAASNATNQEKATLGDLDQLAALKEKLSGN